MEEEIKTTRLNSRLIKQQRLTQAEVDLIEQKHEELDKLIDMINGLEWNEDNKQRILQLTKSVELYEFELQKLWKFEQNEKFHNHWLRNKHCCCPRMDNRDIAYYGGGKILRSDCKIHGEEAQPEFWKNLKETRDYKEYK